MPTHAVTRPPGTWWRRIKRLAYWMAVASIGTGLGLLIADGVRWWFTSPTFAIARIEVTGARRAPEVHEGLADLEGKNIWCVSSAQILQRILAVYPWVGQVRVEKVPPDTVRILVSERMPVAAARDRRGEPVALDGEGWCFHLDSTWGRKAYDLLPFIPQVAPELVFSGTRVASVSASTCLAVAAAFRAGAERLWRQLESIEVTRFGDLRLCTRGPAGEVLLPPLRTGLPLERLALVWDELQRRAMACARVDLRSERSLVALLPLPTVSPTATIPPTHSPTPETGWEPVPSPPRAAVTQSRPTPRVKVAPSATPRPGRRVLRPYRETRDGQNRTSGIALPLADHGLLAYETKPQAQENLHVNGRRGL